MVGREDADRVCATSRPMSSQESSSLTEVVYRMVQTRKKQTLGSSLSVPSSRAASTTSARGGRLSVTFSLRRKSKKASHKLQRIASEKPNTQKRNAQPTTQILLNPRDSAANLSDGPACHSSPDVRRYDTPEEKSSSPIAYDFCSESRVDMK